MNLVISIGSKTETFQMTDMNEAKAIAEAVNNLKLRNANCELASIPGNVQHFKTLDDIPEELRGKF